MSQDRTALRRPCNVKILHDSIHAVPASLPVCFGVPLHFPRMIQSFLQGPRGGDLHGGETLCRCLAITLAEGHSLESVVAIVTLMMNRGMLVLLHSSSPRRTCTEYGVHGDEFPILGNSIHPASCHASRAKALGSELMIPKRPKPYNPYSPP